MHVHHSIKRVNLEEVWHLRQEVMWPDHPIDFVKIPGEEDAHHFGIFFESRLIACVSLFQHKNHWKFRKLATLPNFQGQGYGGSLIKFIKDYVNTNQGTILTCDARLEKTAFYEKFGFKKEGDPFLKYGKPYQKMELKFE